MILTGPEISARVADGTIVIDPFDPGLVNPNSYNYRLGDELLVPADGVFDSRLTPVWSPTVIPSGGYTLLPNRIYLSHTAETIGSAKYVTTLIGRSSVGRLGLFLQVTADLGHVGAVHRWTLELHAIQPLRVYPGMRIGQVSFWRTEGESKYYTGQYASHSSPTPNLTFSSRVGAP